MFDVFGLKKIWDTFSPWASQENPLHAEFQAGIEREMQRNGIEDARMVGSFCLVDQEFMKTLYRAGFRNIDNGHYSFSRAAVFVADIDSATLEQDLTEGRSMAFLGTQDDEGNFQLLNVVNFARSNSLDITNARMARDRSHSFRRLLQTLGSEITPEKSGMYQAPTNVSHVAPVRVVSAPGFVLGKAYV